MTSSEELILLKKTFEEFMRSSRELEHAYENLKAESSLLSLYLSNILENLDHAILVFDNRGILKITNRRAAYYFPVLKKKSPPIPRGELMQGARIEIPRPDKKEKEVRNMKITHPNRREWLELSTSPFLDSRGDQIGSLVIIRDKTRVEEMQQKILREDRLKVMGELAAQVAHEIRNPLGSIELMTSLLSGNGDENPDSRELIRRIRNSVNNMNHIVSNILVYTRELSINASRFPVKKLIHESLTLVWDCIARQEIDLDKDCPGVFITADFEMLKQALANIIKNACQAVPRGGKIRISAKHRSSRGIWIVVEDNGRGMSPDTLKKVFDPFFTTKNTGTGLGLAMVKRVVEAHDGTIGFQSGENGTTCTIRLPDTLEETHA